MLPSGYDTLEYSWVKATAVSVRLRILFVTLQSTNTHIYISEFETPPRPSIEFEPLSSGPEKVVLDPDKDSTTISHDESLEMENP